MLFTKATKVQIVQDARRANTFSFIHSVFTVYDIVGILLLFALLQAKRVVRRN